MPVDVKVRNAVRDDVEKLLPIYNEIILNTTAIWQYEPQTLEMRLTWFDDRQRNGFPVFVAEMNVNGKEQIVGFSSYGNFRIWPGYQYTVENSVYVANEMRGKGIAKMLMTPLINRAKEQKLHAMVAGIEASNIVSIKLHESFGFVEVAHFREVGWKFERWLDLKFLELVLT